MSTSQTETSEQSLAELYRPVAEDLILVERELRKELESKVVFVEELLSRVQVYRGKRLRPALLLLVARACGQVRAAHHTLGAVVEMIHTATLLHDDVLDEAHRRRHVTTVNAEWGNEASILLGDFLFTHAFHLASSLESTFACRMIGKSTNMVCQGELHQISRRGFFELSEEEYLQIIGGKTAELIAVGCRLGAHFAGTSSEIESALESYGRDLGIAFQITDDLLDLLGNESSTGKSTGNDLAKQKMTLPLIRFRDTAGTKAASRCRELFEEQDSDQREPILDCLRESDAVEYAMARAQEYADSAAGLLELLPPSPARKVLETMTRFIIERTT